jgi:hypothetical protein
MEVYKELDQDFYLSGELMAVTGINSGILKKIQKKLKIENVSFQREKRQYSGVKKEDVIRIMEEYGYTRIKTVSQKDLLVRRIIEIK